MECFDIWDMGLVGDTTRTYIIDRIKHVGADFFIHLGDIAYNMEDSYGSVGDMYLSNMEPASSVIPYMTVAGNHEQYNNFTNYYNRFTMPDRNTSHNLWYSLDKPPVKFININSESFYYSFQVPNNKKYGKLHKYNTQRLTHANFLGYCFST